MLSSLLFWDSAGMVVATLDHLNRYDENTGDVIGSVDFEATEATGYRIRNLKNVSNATGGGSWPEWLDGEQSRHFKVELDPSPGTARARIKALVHKESGHRRERAAIEDAITKRIKDAKGKPADIRDLVGGPDRPLQLDENGRTKPKVKAEKSTLPVIRAGVQKGT